ncbi:MAG: DUF488 domain-containing protein [Pirellulales bacterium]|nr:DUF488 domain-containing protein [Pirellulales bacterium]
MRLFTIGFTGKSAKEFFETLQRAGVRRLVDICLKNVSQLAGFTKKKDLEYFLRAIANIDYAHEPGLAPAKEILDGYKKKQIDWAEYEHRFRELLEERGLAGAFKLQDLDHACLLCSEPAPEHCHRRLVAEYLRDHWGSVGIEHL